MRISSMTDYASLYGSSAVYSSMQTSGALSTASEDADTSSVDALAALLNRQSTTSLTTEDAMSLNQSGLAYQMQLNEENRPSEEDRETVMAALDTAASIDLDSASAEEQAATLEALQTSLASADALPPDLSFLVNLNVSDLEESDVTAILAAISDQADAMSEGGSGEVGRMKPMGPPPPPPPEGAAMQDETSSEDEELLSMLQTMLEKLQTASEDEEEESDVFESIAVSGI